MIEKLKRYKEFVRPITILVLIILVIFTGTSYAVIESRKSLISSVESLGDLAPRTAIVFGGGIVGDGPTPLVKERLDTAKSLLDQNIVDTLILSGDNRFIDYNEPLVMFNYLIEDLGVDPDRLQPDFAGRSTYETCERANKVFGLSEALLVSQDTHLPRAVYLCQHFDIQSIGVAAEGPASDRNEGSQTFREIFARAKALFNAHRYGERTVLGDPIEL